MQIYLTSIGRNEISNYVDKYYCLALVKDVKLFTSAFSQDVILILQDNKAKVFIYSFFFFNISFKF